MVLARGIDVRPPHADCESCSLNECPIVEGYGYEQADLVIVGEAPGRDEVNRGRPFVGRAGNLLKQAVTEAGLRDFRVWVTNAVLCRPEDNRNPKSSEIKACRPRLIEEIRARKPRLVLALGNISVQSLVGRSGVTLLRGQFFDTEDLDCPILVSLHPAYVLRSPRAYPDLVNDLQTVRAYLQGELSRDEAPFKWQVAKKPDYFALDATIDIETASDGRVLCLGISGPHPEADVTVVPEHLVEENVQNLNNAWVNGHNVKYEYRVLKERYGVTIHPVFDTMLADYILDERAGTHALEQVIAKHLPGTPDYWSEITDNYYTRMEECPADLMYRYNAHDVYYTHKLWHILAAKMDEDDWRVMNEMLLPASVALGDMELRGIMVDMERATEVGDYLDTEMERLHGEMERVAGCTFNPRSPTQVASILYDILGLPIPVSTGLSTDKDALQALKERHEFPKLMLRYRWSHTLRSRYVNAILEKTAPDGRLRTSFNLHVTATGRLSSSAPNMQNIPKRDEEAKNLIRQCFIASPGHVLVEADFSQAELRVLAHLAQDERLIEAFRGDVDLHTATAALMFSKKPEDVTKRERALAKNINFAAVYGAEADKIRETARKDLGFILTQEEAQRLLDMWNTAYERVTAWKADIAQQVLTNGMVITPFGRKRRWPVEMLKADRRYRSDAMREAVNFPVQSTAADLTLRALIRLHQELPETDHLIITVHDSILVETTRDPKVVAQEMREVMLSVVREDLTADVPFEVECEAGVRWNELQKIV